MQLEMDDNTIIDCTVIRNDGLSLHMQRQLTLLYVSTMRHEMKIKIKRILAHYFN